MQFMKFWQLNFERYRALHHAFWNLKHFHVQGKGTSILFFGSTGKMSATVKPPQ